MMKVERESRLLKYKGELISIISKIGVDGVINALQLDPLTSINIEIINKLKIILNNDSNDDDISLFINDLDMNACEYILSRIKYSVYKKSSILAIKKLKEENDFSAFNKLNIKEKECVIETIISDNDLELLSIVTKKNRFLLSKALNLLDINNKQNILFILSNNNSITEYSVFNKINQLLQSGNIDNIKFAIKNGWDPTSLNNVYIRRCALYNINTFKFLIEECNADPTIYIWILLENIIESNNLEILKYMINNYSEYIDFSAKKEWIKLAKRKNNICYIFLLKYKYIKTE